MGFGLSPYEVTLMIITTALAKMYLRVDSDYEDSLIETMIGSAESMCRDIGRLSDDDWNTICNAESVETDTVINGSVYTSAELGQLRLRMETAVLYALAYMFEHREEADHHALETSLSYILSSLREGFF